MRKTLFLLLFVAFLGVAVPAQAQFRADTPSLRSSTRLYDSGAAGFLLNKLFNPSVFRMSHSLEFSMGSYGGASSSLGMYTNTMAWQFGQKLAARVDMSVAYAPFMNSSSAFGQDTQAAKVFLRNAEIAYRPSDRMEIHLQVRHSPFGRYMNPYGYMSPYGYNPYRAAFMSAGYGPSPDLFWRDSGR